LRQVKALALMIIILSCMIFSSCRGAGSKGQDLALQIRAGLLKAEKLALTAFVTADYGDRVYDFTFSYSGNADEGEIEITSPESIAGVKAKISVSGGTLEYDGAVLDTGAVTKDGLSPAEALPVLISQWQTGYISGCNFEKLGDLETLAVTTDITETVRQRSWFDVKTRLPVRSEITDGVKTVITCEFENIFIE
jgi:outer membrane lipoprotein-sorting protein